MCEIENMIENISVVLNTAATLFAAIAAWFSFVVSKNSLKFQKNYAKNQNLINKLNITITKARALQGWLGNITNISDSEVCSMEPLFFEIKAEVQHLGTIGELEFSSLKISSVDLFGELIDQMSKQRNCLSEVIEVLESKLNNVFK